MKRLLVGLGIALFAALSWILLWQSRRTSEVGAMPAAGKGAAGEAPLASTELAPPARPEEKPPERELVVPAEREALEDAAGAEGALAATVRGRFLLPGGEPAAGVSLAVHGWGANQERMLRYGVPADWVDPAGVSEPDGTFVLVFAPPRAFQFTLDANLEGHAEVAWRWSEILPGKTVDVGDVTLARGGTIEGGIVDADGNPLPGELHADRELRGLRSDRRGRGRPPGRRDAAGRRAAREPHGRVRPGDQRGRGRRRRRRPAPEPGRGRRLARQPGAAQQLVQQQRGDSPFGKQAEGQAEAEPREARVLWTPQGPQREGLRL